MIPTTILFIVCRRIYDSPFLFLSSWIYIYIYWENVCTDADRLYNVHEQITDDLTLKYAKDGPKALPSASE